MNLRLLNASLCRKRICAESFDFGATKQISKLNAMTATPGSPVTPPPLLPHHTLPRPRLSKSFVRFFARVELPSCRCCRCCRCSLCRLLYPAQIENCLKVVAEFETWQRLLRNLWRRGVAGSTKKVHSICKFLVVSLCVCLQSCRAQVSSINAIHNKLTYSLK